MSDEVSRAIPKACSGVSVDVWVSGPKKPLQLRPTVFLRRNVEPSGGGKKNSE
jgi:hypothetical protein